MSYRLFAIGLVWAFFFSTARAELIVFYDFNNASDSDVAVDSSGNENHGEVIIAEYTGDSGGHTGKAGDRAMDFGFYNDGSYVDITTAADGAFESITDSDQFTVSLWIFGNEDQPSPQWTFYAGPGRQLGSHIPWSDGTIYFDVTGCCNANQRIALNEPDDSKWREEWNHYVFLKNEEYTAIYQNGELFHDSGNDSKNPMSDISEFYVGSGPPNDHRSYNGLIDDFGVWDEALSEEDIQKLFDGTFFSPGIPGDFNDDGVLDVEDINQLNWEVASGDNNLSFDLNSDSSVNFDDIKVWVKDLKRTWIGDADLNGEFDSTDLVSVFQTAKFETDTEATWAEGDWDGNHRFDSTDFVVAFQDGGYEMGPVPDAVSSVPEPNSMILLLLGVGMLVRRKPS